MDFESFKKEFADKVRQLRNKKNISAREMSIALGQNVNYINYIENGRHLPSMQGFFSICEFLGIQPSDFFEPKESQSAIQNENQEYFSSLTERQQKAIVLMLREVLTN